MLWALLSSFIGAAATTLLVIALPQRQRRWPRLADLTDFPAPQNVHAHAARRLGGIGIAIGILAGATSLRLEGILPAGLMWSMAAATLPTLAAGIAEDVTESVGPRTRLLCAALSGILGAWLLGALLTHTGWAWLDACLVVPGVAWLLTTFTVAGVVNSFNIIDGMNGLASMFAMLAMAALAYIASRVGDTLVCGMAFATLGASLGFFAWNYPRGLIFLGDGGAYLLGFSAVELGFVLLRRHHEISALAPLVVIAYPVMETVFSMYRRRARGLPVSRPDRIHLHSLIYRRLTRSASVCASEAARKRANSMTSPYLWALSALSIVPTAVWWNDTAMLGATLALFVVAYLWLYRQIVRFRTPRWMLRIARKRARPAQRLDAGASPVREPAASPVAASPAASPAAPPAAPVASPAAAGRKFIEQVASSEQISD